MRISKGLRIQKYMTNAKFDQDSMDLYTAMHKLAKHGRVKGYGAKEKAIVEAFGNDYTRYIAAYRKLLQGNIIKNDGKTLFLLLCNDLHFFNLRNELLEKTTRKCPRLNLHGQEAIPQYHQPKKEELQVPENRIISGGIKVPRSLAPYFTGQVLTSEERENMLQENIDLEERRRDLNKCVKLYYLAWMSQANSNGEIKNFNVNFSVKSLNTRYNFDEFSESTAYYALDMLEGLGLVEMRTNEDNGSRMLVIKGYKEAFERRENYVVLPYGMVFKKKFKDMGNRAINMAFYFLFRLNNGERGDEQGKDKHITFKLYGGGSDTEGEKAKFELTKFMLRRRCNAEIGGIVKPLTEYFNIQPNARTGNRGYYDISLREGYFVEKSEANKMQTFLDPCERYFKKAAIVDELLKKRPLFGMNYEDKQNIVTVLHRASRQVIEKILMTLYYDQEGRRRRGAALIRDYGKYTNWLYKRYKAGDRGLLTDKMCRCLNGTDDLEPEEDYANYPITIVF